MRFEKWTVALAAAGMVSLASAAMAEEKASPVMTALSSTTISGYVDTSAQWNFGTGNTFMPPYRFGGSDKADGFNLDVVQLRIEKPLDESEWSSGYRADLWMGPDANTLGTTSINANGGSSDFAIRQAYVALRAPVGNGLDFKMGVFDSIIGYESLESGNNPNFTRSYGNTMEPTTHTGLLTSYRFNDILSASFGIANSMDPAIDSRAQNGSAGAAAVRGPFANLWNSLYTAFPALSPGAGGQNAKAESFKTYMGSLAVTAPESLGFLAGSTLYGGIASGYNNNALGSGWGDNQTSYYVGGTMATPVTGLRLGAAFDYLDLRSVNPSANTRIQPHSWAVAGYASYQATEKLSLHGRLEYTETNLGLQAPGGVGNIDRLKIVSTTLTAQYDLWKNVLSRVELRWDHSASGNDLFGGENVNTPGGPVLLPSLQNAWMLAANIIYKF
jgi:hypothetical protein